MSNKRNALKALDCISRQAAIEEIARWIGYIDEDMILRIQTGMKKLPSAQPERKEGWWEEDMQEWPGRYRCSECRRPVWFPENFCPNCGARMEATDERT